MTTAEDLAEGLEAKRTGKGKWMAKCPVHDDRSESLSISSKRDGSSLIHCFAGCEFRDLVRELEARGLWESSPRPAGPPQKKIDWARWVVSIYEDNKRNGRYIGGGQYEPWQPSAQDHADYRKARAVLREVE